MITSVVASHSVIPRMFSGNSSAAEIHLEIFLVGLSHLLTGTVRIGCFHRQE